MLSIELIQVALGKRERLSRTPTAAEWKNIYQLGIGHTISGVLFRGVERLPKEQLPPRGIILKWFGLTERIRGQKTYIDEVMADFARLMQREHIVYVVFKGLAVASQYQNPASRIIGDIDFYVPKSDFARCLSVIETNLGVVVEKEDIDKHYAFDWRNVRFEMHYQMETFGRQRHQRYFGRLVDDGIMSSDDTFEVDGARVAMLPPMIDLMLVFKHWMGHYIGEGIGLRQTIDLAVLIEVYRDHLDVEALKRHLSAIGYLKAFDAVVALVERYFRTPWPEYWERGIASLKKGKAFRYADMLMADVIKNGNFGRSDYKYKRGTMKRVETTWRFLRHCSKCLPLAFTEMVCMLPKRINISIKAH